MSGDRGDNSDTIALCMLQDSGSTAVFRRHTEFHLPSISHCQLTFAAASSLLYSVLGRSSRVQHIVTISLYNAATSVKYTGSAEYL